MKGCKEKDIFEERKESFMKKAIIILVALATLGTIVFSVSASASFGAGVEVMTDAEKLVKTGLFGKKLNFSDVDFKQGLTISDFDSITITKIPPSSEGTLLFAGRRVSEGTKIRRKNVSSLVFIPASESVKESSFYFSVSPYLDENEIEFKLKFTDKINYEPKIENTSPTAILTQRDISIYGKMTASDGEGDKIEYIVVKYPKNGTLELVGEDGKFRYEPNANFIGEDSFVYVARDEWGNFSEICEMPISVSERLTELEFSDMKNREEYNASLTLASLGIMGGKTIGDGVYFMPEEEVTKAEFVAMLMKTLDIKADTTLTVSYFDDGDKIPTPLLSYVCTAERIGLINGSFEEGKLNFHPNDKITSYEAASIIAKAIGKSSAVSIPEKLESELPVFAREDVYLMCASGIFDMEFSEVKRDDFVTKAECATYLYNLLIM